jgi:hypothetical protein
MLITASWVEQVQKMLGLDGVSQVWGERPEWYIWIHGAPGAYALAFEEGVTCEEKNQPLNLGQFAVKCYPYVDAGVFDTFAPQECKMVTSDLFDHTHTPRLEARHRLPEAFFAVGSLAFKVNAAGTVAMLTYDSIDFLKWSTLTAKTGKRNSPNDSLDKNVIRNIPAWQVGYPLFDRLISLYAFYSKQTPAFIGVTQSPGFECMLDNDQIPESRVCDQTRQYSASVLFFNAAGSEQLIEDHWRAHLDREENIIFERAYFHPACNCLAQDGPPQVAINSLWWDLARADLKSELATTCGCGDHEHLTFEDMSIHGKSGHTRI